MSPRTRLLPPRRRATARADQPVRDERGSAVLEVALGAPAFVLLVGLIIAGGRISMEHESIETAAASAAREASIARTQPAAQSAAKAGANASLSNQKIDCLTTTVRVNTHGFQAPLGKDSRVKATVSCVVRLSDVTIPGLPGSKRITATASSPIDTYRER